MDVSFLPAPALSSSPSGFIFVLDKSPDGNFGLTWYDYVVVASLPPGAEMEVTPDNGAILGKDKGTD